MTDSSAENLQASFIQGVAGKLFCIRSIPAPAKAKNHSILLVPPFAEEMNCCRRFFAMVRRSLCHKGFTVVQPDLYGTGDSEGEFSEATWSIWLDDLSQLIADHCREDREKLSVLAVRSP